MFDSVKVLVAAADDRSRDALVAQLTADGAVVRHAADLRSAVARITVTRPDVLITGELDVPTGCVELIRSIRASTGLRTEAAPDLAILALVDSRDEMVVLRCFETGADDVAGRDVGYPVLRARLRALLGLTGRHAATTSTRTVGPLEVNLAGREVRLRDERLALSGKEFALLSALITDPERVFTRDELLRDVWGFHSSGQTRTLDTHVMRLRRKLGIHGDAFIVTVWGIGYRLIDRPARPVEAVA